MKENSAHLSWLPGKSNVHIVFWICILLICEIVLQAADFEQRALNSPARYAGILIVSAIIAASAAWRNSRSAKAETESLQFEDAPSWRLTTLDL